MYDGAQLTDREIEVQEERSPMSSLSTELSQLYTHSPKTWLSAEENAELHCAVPSTMDSGWSLRTIIINMITNS